MLIGVFGFLALQAVILNKAMSLIVVLTALPVRLISVPYGDLAPYWYVVVNLLAGSLIGAWIGATWATRMRSATLYKVIAVLLVVIAAALATTHLAQVGSLDLPPIPRTVLGVPAGVGIGVVAAVMGVAGGELLIPTIVLLYGVDKDEQRNQQQGRDDPEQAAEQDASDGSDGHRDDKAGATR